MNDIQTKIWEKEISKLTKRLNKSKLEEYKNIIMATSGVDENLKQEYVQKCDEAINKINNINAEKVKTGEKTKHSKVGRRALMAAVGVATVITVAGISCHSCSGPKSPATKTEAPTNPEKPTPGTTNPSIDKEINENLNFDVENTEVMVSNINKFFGDSLGKGVYLDKDNLPNELEAFVDFYVALNIDEIGPGYLASLYQNDNKSYIDAFNGYVHWAMKLTDTAMLSTKDNVINIESMIANKEEGEMLQQAFNLLAEIHDNGLAGNKEALTNNAASLKALLTKVLINESDLYSSSSKVMLSGVAINADTLLINYEDIKVVDDDMRKVMYEDAAISCAFTIKEAQNNGNALNYDDLVLLINNSEKSQSAVSMVTQLKDKYNLSAIILNTTDKDYSSEVSVKEVIDEIESSIDLSLYKEIQSLKEYNDLTYEINHPTVVIPEDSIVVKDEDTDKDIFIPKEEIDKYVPETENKTPEQIKDEYEQNKKEEIEEELKDDKTLEDNNGNVLATGDKVYDAEAEFKKGMTDGSAQGAYDGQNMKPKNDSIDGNEVYVAAYKEWYNISYDEAVATREKAEQEKKEEVAPIVIMPIEQSNQVTKTEVKEEAKVETTTVVQTEVKEETKVETTTEVKTTETTNQEKSSQMSYDDELYEIYYNILYGSETNTVEQGYAKTK